MPRTFGLSVTEAAKALGVTRQALSDVVNERAAVSVEMAIRLSKAFGSSPETWLGMQMAYDLWQARSRTNRIRVRSFKALGDITMMRRDIFTEEHEMFRAQVRRFVDTEIEPKVPEWNRAGMSDRASWRKMGEAGFLGANAPAEYGGGGVDFIYDAIVMEELSRVRAHGLMMSLHSDICMPYITSFGNEEQKRRYLPGAISGETILAIAMTEPGTGSDLAAVQTTARRDGDHYVINGSKIFISNGQIADLVIVVVQDRSEGQPAAQGRQPDAGRCERARLRSRPQARQARAARPGHQRVVLRGLPRPGRQPAR